MGKKAPKSPDPAKVAAAQSEANIKTAQEQARLAMTGQDTAYGSIRYVADPTSPSGYRQITELSPEQQALFQQNQDYSAQKGSIMGSQLGRVGDTLSNPFDMNAARSTEISDMQRTFLDPQWDQRAEALEVSLLNRGIRPGSEAYNREMERFGNQRSSAYDQMFLNAYTTANNAALTERNQGLTELNALAGGGMMPNPQSPQAPNTPTPGVAPTDITGPTYQNYNAQQNAYNSQMGGLYGLGSAALGGWASSGGLTSALAALPLLSDPRLKEHVEKIGDDPRGWGVYLYKYVFDLNDGADPTGEPEWQVGYMADEVEKVRPDAVFMHPSGFKAVNYDALADAGAA